MNGWHRLYVVFTVLLVAAFVLKLYQVHPSNKSHWLAVGCSDNALHTQESARQALAKAEYLTDAISPGVCRGSLEAIASGQRWDEDMDNWWVASGLALGAVTVILLIVYATGLVCRWVWRGFSPKSSAR